MSHRKLQNTQNGLSEDFLKAIEKGDENQVRRILREHSHNGSEGINHLFKARKIGKAQDVLTPLHLAVKSGNKRIVGLLLENGISVSATDQHKCTALHTAVKDQDVNVAIMRLLLDHRDIDVNAVDEYKNTPLKLAAETGNMEAVKLLIDSRADITKADIVGNTAIHVAAEKGHFNVLYFLVRKIAQNAALNSLIGSQNEDRNTPLHLAVKKQCQKSVSILLCYGASVTRDTKNQHSETPKQLAEDKEIIKLLQDPSKAVEQLQEWLRTSKPSVNVMGMGSQVEADSPGNLPITEQMPVVTSSNSLLPGLPRLPGLMQYAIVNVHTKQFNIANNFKAEVHNGGIAAIGPDSQVNLGGSAVAAGVRPQPAAESTYNTNVSGGGIAAIGDNSVTNVGTGSPRSASSASSSSGSSEDGPSSEGSEHRGNRIEGGSGCPTESASVGAVAHPIQEEKSSGNPTENASKTPEQLPLPVPEESKKGNALGTTGELSHPVPERACPRTPTENAESDDPLKLPHSIPEESHPRKSELVTSTNSDIAGKLTKETPSSCDRVATEATEQSKEVKSRRTVDTSNTPTATNTGTMRNNSVSSSAPNEPVPSEYGINARGVRKAPVKGKINDSPGNTRTNQATGTSGNLEQPNTVAHKSSIRWGQQMQKQGSKEPVALSRAAPTAIGKRLLEMNSPSTSCHEAPDSLLSQMEGFNSSSDNWHLPETQEGLKAQWHDLDSQPATGNVTEVENTSAGSDVKLIRVGLSRSPGPPVLLSKGGGGLEDGATSRLSSSAKEAPHRKERFLRENSSPDEDNPTVERAQNVTAAAVTVQDQSANSAGVVGMNTMEQESASRGGMNTETVIINLEPEDDSGGKKRCDSECTVM